MPDVGHGRIDDFRRRDPLPLDQNRGGIHSRHVQDVLEETRQAAELRRREVGLRFAFVSRQLAAKVLDGDAGRRQRRLEVVAQGRQKRRCKIRLLPNALRGVAFAEKLRALDGNRDDAAKRIQRAEIEIRRARREQAHGLHTVAQRHDFHAGLGVADLHVSAIGALVRVELQRPSRLRERRIQDILVDGHVAAPP